VSQTFSGYSPPPIKQKSSYQHGSKSGQVPRYPLLCRNPRNAVIHKKHATMSNARQYLNDHFPGKLIGRNGPVAWPPPPQSYRFLPLGPTLKIKFTPHPLPMLTSYRTHRSYIWCHQEPTGSAGTRQGIHDATSQRMCCGERPALWTSYVILKRVPAHERKSISRNLITFGPMLMGTFLLKWGWGIPRKSLWHRFWDTLYTTA
jgi:hypothetical protein